MRAENNLEALRMALSLRGIDHYHHPFIHHADKEAQYVSDMHTDILEGYGIQISLCAAVYENNHMERINDTIKDQHFNRMEIKSIGH